MQRNVTGPRSVAARWGKTLTKTIIGVMSFAVMVGVFTSVGFAGASVLAEVGTGTAGLVSKSVLPAGAGTPHLSDGVWLRLSIVKDASVLERVGEFFRGAGESSAVPVSPKTLAGESGPPAGGLDAGAAEGREENRHLDTWVSQSLAYAAALRAVTYNYSLPAPSATDYGDSYIFVEKDGHGYRRGDVVFPGEGDRRLMRDGKVVGVAPSENPADWSIVREYPHVPRALVEKDLSGPSAGLLFALQYVDALTPGSLIGGHTVAATGTIDNHGQVGDIGGAAAKVSAAADAGAEVVFVPAQNANEVNDVSSASVHIVAVSSLVEAVEWLCGKYRSDDAVCTVDPVNSREQ